MRLPGISPAFVEPLLLCHYPLVDGLTTQILRIEQDEMDHCVSYLGKNMSYWGMLEACGVCSEEKEPARNTLYIERDIILIFVKLSPLPSKLTQS